MKIWKETIYTPNYEVSNLGNIKNKNTKRVKRNIQVTILNIRYPTNICHRA